MRARNRRHWARPRTTSLGKPKLRFGPQAEAFRGAQIRHAMPYLDRCDLVFLCIPIRSLQTSRCAMATSLSPSSSSPHLSIFKLKPFAPLKSSALPLPVAYSLSASSQRTVKSGSSLRASDRNPRVGSWRLRAAAEDALESSQQIVSSPEGVDGVSNVVSVLLLIAFIGLSILTIGVIYIAVTDFLQKREREKFDKEEAEKKKKKGGKKGRVRARAGPRGFGQRVDEDEDD